MKGCVQVLKGSCVGTHLQSPSSSKSLPGHEAPTSLGRLKRRFLRAVRSCKPLLARAYFAQSQAHGTPNYNPISKVRCVLLPRGEPRRDSFQRVFSQAARGEFLQQYVNSVEPSVCEQFAERAPQQV